MLHPTRLSWRHLRPIPAYSIEQAILILYRRQHPSKSFISTSSSPNRPTGRRNWLTCLLVGSGQPMCQAGQDGLQPEIRKPKLSRLSSFYLRALKTTVLRREDEEDLARVLAQGLAFTSYGFVLTSVLGTIGVDTKPLVTGLGITGFTVGFALKDVATHVLAGFMLVWQRPFRTGSMVRLYSASSTAWRGRVVSIDYRYIHVALEPANPNKGQNTAVDSEKKETQPIVMIPSYLVYSQPIVIEEDPPEETTGDIAEVVSERTTDEEDVDSNDDALAVSEGESFTTKHP